MYFNSYFHKEIKGWIFVYLKWIHNFFLFRSWTIRFYTMKKYNALHSYQVQDPLCWWCKCLTFITAHWDAHESQHKAIWTKCVHSDKMLPVILQTWTKTAHLSTMWIMWITLSLLDFARKVCPVTMHVAALITHAWANIILEVSTKMDNINYLFSPNLYNN